jgi:hypothetical protein
MKSILVLLGVAMLAAAGYASADYSGEAVTSCFVNVDPNITLFPLDDNVDMGIIQVGEIPGYIPWRVDANTQNVAFWGAASYLFKGGDYSDPSVPPVMLWDDPEYYGVFIDVPDGGPVGDEDNFLAFINATEIEGFPGMESEQAEFESSQFGHFSQDILMTVWWFQDDPEKPMGEYKGKARLSAMVVLLP